MKKFVSLVLSVCFLFSISAVSYAANTNGHKVSNPVIQSMNDRYSTYLPVAENTSSNESSRPRVPNAIPIDVIAKVDGTGVKVNVGNVGVDGLDNVKVTVTATGYANPKTQSAYVPPIIGKTFDFDFPYIRCNTIYNVTIDVVDGSGTKHLTGTAKLTWSEDNLKNAHWNRGSSSTRAASLEYHFSKHGSEVGATNLVEYLNFANSYRDQVLYDLNRGNTSDYYITDSPTPTPGKKYKSKSSKQFIILANSNQDILTYGI